MFKKIKDLVLMGVGIFFLLGAIVMVKEDIVATITFGVFAVILLFFSKDVFIDYINKNKMKKL